MFTPRLLLALLISLLTAAGTLLFFKLPEAPAPKVVIYSSVDDVFALPLFEKFTRETGIKVEYRFDGEETKTTGLAGRLMQMKGRPDGDVFWNSELSMTQLLAAEGALEPYLSPNAAEIPAQYKDAQHRWTGFGCRARVLVYNTNKVRADELPRTLEDLAAPRWKGRFAIAKPLYGTTRSHLVSLLLALGDERGMKLFRAWRENGVMIAESNSDVCRCVAEGIVELGLTDTDDALSARDRNRPVNFIVADQAEAWRGTYLIPNTVAILKNCPHPEQARAFIDYLLRPQTEKWLAENGARQIPVRDVGAKLVAPFDTLKLQPASVDVERLAREVLPLGEKIYRVLRGEE